MMDWTGIASLRRHTRRILSGGLSRAEPSAAAAFGIDPPIYSGPGLLDICKPYADRNFGLQSRGIRAGRRFAAGLAASARSVWLNGLIGQM